MAEQSGFFPDVSGDRQYTADFLAQWIASVIGNGVYNGDLAVTAGGNMQINVPSGRAWINGYHYRNDGDITLAIANADGVLNRKDTVVLRWDINARSITAQILQGTPASNPAAPAITRSVDQFDLKLAEISIPAGTTAVTQALITDTRLDNSVCGIVTGVVSQVDTTKLYNQIQNDLSNFKNGSEASFSTWSDQQKTSFNTWLDGIKQALDESTAGNLLNMINTHTADTVAHMTQAQKDTLASAIQSSTLGGTAVPKSGTVLQFPAYPTSLPANGGNAATLGGKSEAQLSVNYASSAGYAGSAGSAPANGGTATYATYATYSTHAIGSGSPAVRNVTTSSNGPSGGQDGDLWLYTGG